MLEIVPQPKAERRKRTDEVYLHSKAQAIDATPKYTIIKDGKDEKGNDKFKGNGVYIVK